MLRVLALTAFAALAAAVPAPAAAAPRPDLVVARASSTPASAFTGTRITVRATLRNRGGRSAKASRVAVLLSTDGRRSAKDVALAARTVGALRPSRARSASLTAVIPLKTAQRAYRVLVCADAARRVRERREDNNCRATPLRVLPRADSIIIPGGGPRPDVGAPSAGGDGDGAGDDDPPAGPQPADAVLQLDHAHKRSGRIGSAGGALTATAADGTKYTLTLPDGALASEEEITLTPVAQIAGLPYRGGVAGAVQLAPDGLALYEPATLEIEDGASVDGRPTGFGWSGDGKRVHMEPLGAGLSLELWHFSGYGAAGASASEITEQLALTAWTPYERARQQFAEIHANARACGEHDPVCGAIAAAQTRAVLLEWLEAGIRPDLADAKVHPENAPQAIRRAFEWARLAQMKGLGDELAPQIESLVETIAELVNAAIDEAEKSCDPTKPATVTRVVALYRDAALLGGGDDVDVSGLSRCASYTITLESKFVVKHLMHRVVADEMFGVDVRDVDELWRATAKVGPIAVDTLSGTATRDDLLPTYSDWHHHENFKLCQTSTDGVTDCQGYENTWTADLGDPEFPEELPMALELRLVGASPTADAGREPHFELLVRIAKGSPVKRTTVRVSHTRHVYDYSQDSTSAPTMVDDAGWYAGFAHLNFDPAGTGQYVDTGPGCEPSSAFMCMRYAIAPGVTVITQEIESGKLDDTGKTIKQETTTITLGSPD